MQAYRTPAGSIPAIYADMIRQPHLLIAGATGSGKSVAISGMIAAAIYHGPAYTRSILIDPKRVELKRYERLPHTITRASDPDDIINALQQALTITEKRFQDMERRDILQYDGPDLYVIIDELADLMTTDKKRAAPLIQRLGQIGRAARVHLIAATQCPLAQVIPTAIKCNLDARLALHTRNEQDSRNILGITGAESLPRYGEGIYMNAEGYKRVELPMIPANEIQRLIQWWTGPACWAV